ncbi:hypothetical protein VVD49_08135 [Uliginosibacterium sp. H3]|uniref:ABC transporter substrate-binding protein n=1 Tax=Uliginosibacterium silvisoli TaxID=3114758 RepID=A0ABU6K1L4_9RHOO|nr:hypothetical protein [Uliginosibacterium sp. H3]
MMIRPVLLMLIACFVGALVLSACGSMDAATPDTSAQPFARPGSPLWLEYLHAVGR